MTAENRPRGARLPDKAGRFAALPRALAALILAAVAGLIAIGLPFALNPRPTPPPAHSVNGIVLYGRILERMKGGEAYEVAAVDELRAEGGPLKPFVTVRPPWLAWALSRLPDAPARDRALQILGLAVVVAWAVRLRPYGPGPLWIGFTALAAFAGAGASMLGAGSISLFHEAWAGLLIALSLALRTDRRVWLSVVVGLIAALVRELALPFLAVMALVAFAERRRTEGVAWSAALALALTALAWHASQVTALTRAGDFTSPGWVAFAGWDFVILSSKWNLAVMAAGLWVGAFLVPLSLLGAAGRRDGLGLRLLLLAGGYCLGFMVIGRPSNAYWGLVTAPILAAAFSLAPLVLVDLARDLRKPS